MIYQGMGTPFCFNFNTKSPLPLKTALRNKTAPQDGSGFFPPGYASGVVIAGEITAISSYAIRK
jgi:hypothetical protein